MGGRIACTKDNPSDGVPYKWYHPDAISIENYYDSTDKHDDYETLKCPHCKLIFDVTIPN